MDVISFLKRVVGPELAINKYSIPSPTITISKLYCNSIAYTVTQKIQGRLPPFTTQTNFKVDVPNPREAMRSNEYYFLYVAQS